ncbi:MarR family winged helix-turn-helix transcriptional regulator [Streptomyces silaceus]|uniref:MarR family winged helix-turn-helix transcriptional regulator n=1 Tax=Streptomyces silaceus TaxID=545123 RepID=UPI0006EB9222|nr:MarR family transcriptional regulator [Streptomyces silaceus]
MSGHPGEPTPEQVSADLANVVGRFVRRLRGAAPDTGLSPSQRSVLAHLSREGPATTAALARAELVRPQSMRMTVGALESMGFVTRTPDPDDGRQSVVSVTDEGRRTFADMHAAKRSWLSVAIADELDPAERRQLADAVALLERLVRK